MALSPRQKYIERVRDALTLNSAKEMPRAQYIEALEEISDDIQAMLNAAREEAANED